MVMVLANFSAPPWAWIAFSRTARASDWAAAGLHVANTRLRTRTDCHEERMRTSREIGPFDQTRQDHEAGCRALPYHVRTEGCAQPLACPAGSEIEKKGEAHGHV